ncbi:MAG: hypothetical protein PHC64_01430 [Candidatus Gastranaerophilales bacterium]|nr:hypothetical protein [Candidatus Gastranaerophilales bacterium]
MVSSINDAASDSIELLMAQMYQKMSAADTDGTKGLSKDELLSIDTGDDEGGAAFLKALSEQFDALDADGDGQLSSEEISSAKPPSEPMGPPPGISIESSNTDNTQSFVDNLLKALLESFVDNFDKDASSENADKVNTLASSADTDSSGGISSDELATIDTSGDNGKAGLVNDLTENFKSYDIDGNGELSAEEIQKASSEKQFSQQDFASLGSDLGRLSATFINKLIAGYKSGGLSNLASSLNVAV